MHAIWDVEYFSKDQKKSAQSGGRGNGPLAWRFFRFQSMYFCCGVLLWISFLLQAAREMLWFYQPRSQPAGSCFMVQLQEIISQTQKRPLHLDLDHAPEQEAAEVHILLHHGKDALRLDASVDTQQLPEVCVDFLFHFFTLTNKLLRYVQNLAALLQRFLAVAAEALLL